MQWSERLQLEENCRHASADLDAAAHKRRERIGVYMIGLLRNGR
jgi:hypothetical protein